MMILLAGCSSIRCYFKDRGCDTLDIFTLAVEDQTLACSVQILYPLGFSSAEGKGFGLREGYTGSYDYVEKLQMIIPYSNVYIDMTFNPENDKRNKGYYYTTEDILHWRSTVIGANIGVIYGLRAGISLAEVLDFVLGFGTVDIMSDDISKSEAVGTKIEKLSPDRLKGNLAIEHEQLE